MTEETQKTTAKERREREILERLAELGGAQVQDDAITFEGTKFMVPKTMTAKEAVRFLKDYIKQQEEEHRFNRTFNYRPWDGAHAFQSALKKVTGTTGLGKKTFSLFGSNPPQMTTINVGPNKTKQVPWGAVEIPMLHGTARLNSSRHEELGPIFNLIIDAPRKYRAQIEGLFKAIEDELENNSIYKGQAIDGQTMPDFKDTSVVDPAKIVYSESLQRDLDALLWRFIENREELTREGIPFKRAVVLAGRYGTGKTETANITAKYSVEEEITFIQVRPNKDDLGLAMQTARLYQPAVVFFEDIDVLADSDSQKNGTVSRLLDIFDGMDAKHNDVMVVLTTNHVEKIHKGMMRPGRIDAVIEIGALDAAGIEKMAENRIGTENIGDVDWEAVYNAMEGYMPAFVNEALKRVVLYHENGDVFETEDFIAAAEGLRSQFELMEEASEGTPPDRIGEALIDEVHRAVHGVEILDYDGDQVGEYGMQLDSEKKEAKLN